MHVRSTGICFIVPRCENTYTRGPPLTGLQATESIFEEKPLFFISAMSLHADTIERFPSHQAALTMENQTSFNPLDRLLFFALLRPVPPGDKGVRVAASQQKGHVDCIPTKWPFSFPKAAPLWRFATVCTHRLRTSTEHQSHLSVRALHPRDGKLLYL